MTRQKFQVGTRVKVKSAFKTPENKRRAKEDTYGTINSVFEVVSCAPSIEIRGETSPRSYWITPVGKPHSTFCMYEHELFVARGGDKSGEEAVSVADSDPDPDVNVDTNLLLVDMDFDVPDPLS